MTNELELEMTPEQYVKALSILKRDERIDALKHLVSLADALGKTEAKATFIKALNDTYVEGYYQVATSSPDVFILTKEVRESEQEVEMLVGDERVFTDHYVTAGDMICTITASGRYRLETIGAGQIHTVPAKQGPRPAREYNVGVPKAMQLPRIQNTSAFGHAGNVIVDTVRLGADTVRFGTSVVGGALGLGARLFVRGKNFVRDAIREAEAQEANRRF